MTDKHLIDQLRDPKTQRRAFGDIVVRYSEQMYWKARRIVIRHEDADDVVQNAFVKAWSKLDDFRGESSLSTWLYRIVINESLDYIRKKHEMVATGDEMKELDSSLADEFFDGDETERLLLKAVESLPDAQKVTFNLRYYDEMPYKEMSQLLGTSEAGLKTNYHLAVKKIKEFFSKHG